MEPTLAEGRLTAAALEVGNTPLLRLEKVWTSERIRIFAKAEWLNPGGSVKDRAALWMVRQGESAGTLQGRILLDATSGNTGIAYAWLGARLGFPVRLCVPKNINPQRRKVLEAYGAELVWTDPLEGSDGAIRAARRLHAEKPGLYFYPDQYNNPANWRSHYESTAPEIWRQAGGVTHFVAGLGTSGTFTGTGRRLRELNPKITLVAVQPDSPFHGLEGLKHIQSSIVPGIYDPRLADECLFVSTEEAQAVVRRVAREEGLLVGSSGGANLAGALRLAERLEKQGREAAIVTLFPDSGERYLEEAFWRPA